MVSQARRNLWDTITDCTQGVALLLTTHALDEAEALCSRVGSASSLSFVFRIASWGRRSTALPSALPPSLFLIC